MTKTRTIVSGAIALAHTIVMPLTEREMEGAVFLQVEWWSVVTCIILFSGVFSLLLITAQETKLVFSHFLNIFAGMLIFCWFVFVLANNITNLERGLMHSLGVCLIYLASILFLGFIIGAIIDKILKKSRL